MARCSIESEYRSHANLAAEVLCTRSLLKELLFPLSQSAILWCDNQSALALASNLDLHSKSKHIELDIQFLKDKVLIRDKVLTKEIDLRYVPSEDQLAECFTKALSTVHF